MFRGTFLGAIVTAHTFIVASALGAVLCAAGCADRNAEALESIRTKMCECESASCAQQELQHVPNDTKPTPHTREIARAMLDCLAKRLEAERPVTDPDAEAPAGEPGAPAPAAAAPTVPAPSAAKTR
jgi:hypothetical protein